LSGGVSWRAEPHADETARRQGHDAITAEPLRRQSRSTSLRSSEQRLQARHPLVRRPSVLFACFHLVYRCSLRGGSFEAESSNTKKLRIFCKYERNNLVLSIHCQCGVVISITNCYIRFTLLYTVHALRKLNALQLKPRLWLQRAFVITGECLSFSPFYQPRLWRGNNSCGTRPGPSRGTCSGWKGPMPWLCPGSRKILGNNGGARRQDVNAAR